MDMLGGQSDAGSSLYAWIHASVLIFAGFVVCFPARRRVYFYHFPLILFGGAGGGDVRFLTIFEVF